MELTGGDSGQPSGAGGDPADEPVRLACARRLFARLARALDDEIERLSRLNTADPDEVRVKAVADLIRDTQRALMTVLDFENRLARRDPGEDDGVLDLEAARAEITGRLARLAQRG